MGEVLDLGNLWEQVNADDVNIAGSVFKLLLSMVLGAMVGLERRHKGQIAGMRTFALICMGATLAMLVSIYIPEQLFGAWVDHSCGHVDDGINRLGCGCWHVCGGSDSECAHYPGADLAGTLREASVQGKGTEDCAIEGGLHREGCITISPVLLETQCPHLG